MKKIILILGGVSFLMLGIIYVLYTNHIEKKEVNIDIFDDEATLENEDFEDDKEEEHTFKVSVDIKGMVLNPGVYEMDNNSRVEDQTTPNMIQGISGIYERNPLISKGILPFLNFKWFRKGSFFMPGFKESKKLATIIQ